MLKTSRVAISIHRSFFGVSGVAIHHMRACSTSTPQLALLLSHLRPRSPCVLLQYTIYSGSFLTPSLHPHKVDSGIFGRPRCSHDKYVQERAQSKVSLMYSRPLSLSVASFPRFCSSGYGLNGSSVTVADLVSATAACTHRSSNLVFLDAFFLGF
jgi:hypothetical protein